MSFKKGDKVRALENSEYSITKNGWEGTVTEDEDSDGYMEVTGPNLDVPVGVRAKLFELINKKGMSNLANAAKAMKRMGPKKPFKVVLAFSIDVQATEKDEAREIVESLISKQGVVGFKDGEGKITPAIAEIFE